MLKEALVGKGVMQLPIGHAAALKPAVKDVLHPAQLALALAAGDCEVVDLVPVEVCDLHSEILCSAVAIEELVHDMNCKDVRANQTREPNFFGEPCFK